MLELKLDVVGEDFDFFVIQEGALTHTGLPKKLLFDFDNFPEFKDKIIYLPLFDFWCKQPDLEYYEYGEYLGEKALEQQIKYSEMRIRSNDEFKSLDKVYPLVPERTCVRTDHYWENEFIMRNDAMDVIRQISNEDTIILSEDLDEVIKPEIMKQWDPSLSRTASFETQFSYYHFNQKHLYVDRSVFPHKVNATSHWT